MTTPITSLRDIPARLRALSAEMRAISDAMAYFGGLNTVMVNHANQLAGAAAIAAEWADCIESDLPAEQPAQPGATEA